MHMGQRNPGIPSGRNGFRVSKRWCKVHKALIQADTVSVEKWVRSVFRTDYEPFLQTVGFDGEGRKVYGK